ncbi:hypothetical protein EDD21DRAFT_371450 [Dissophora ornata]|nr:hypothetical protein BGZ58_007053 [Dissophora ornata]KAI8602582.1 hypothetical protein EDD21DRAFT_371450 [Dissophora ornata]
MRFALPPNTGVRAGNSTTIKGPSFLKMKLLLTLTAAYCLLVSTANGAAISKRNEEARMKHLYSAYDAIVHSDSQLPVFLQHHRQKSPALNTRTSNGASSGTSNKSKSKRKSKNQQPEIFASPQHYSENLREPREPLLKIQAGPKKSSMSDDSDINNKDNKTVTPRTAGGDSETAKPLFVDGTGTATETTPETETETGMRKLVVNEDISVILNGLNDNDAKIERALDNDERTSNTSVESVVNAEIVTKLVAGEVSETAEAEINGEMSLSEAGDKARVATVPERKRSLIVGNDREYEQEDGYQPKDDTMAPANRHYHIHNPDDENFIVRFIHGHPSANVDDDGDAFPCNSLHPSFYPSFSIAVDRTVIIYAFAFTSVCWLILISSYKMYARRRNTTPIAFFHHIARGIFISPFGEPSSLSTSMPTMMYPRSSPKESLPLHMNEKLLVEENAASASSVRTGQVPTDLRRTSASQYHLQQQLEAARNAYQSQT